MVFDLYEQERSFLATLFKNINLYTYQDNIISEAIKRNSYALFVEMGLGKTLMAISLMAIRVMLGQVNRVLVVCPKTVAGSWLNEIERVRRFLGIYFSLDVKNLTGLSLKELSLLLNDLSRLKYDLVIDIINFEKIALYNGEFPQYDMLIIDESTRIKNPFAKRTIAVFEKFKKIPYRIVLTGSPVVRDMSDLWAQLHLVDAISIGFKDFKKEVKKDREKWLLYAKDNVISLTKEDIERLGLMKFPKKVYKTFYFSLGKEALHLYNDVLARAQSYYITRGNRQVLETLIRLQRITSGLHPYYLTELEDNKKKKLLGAILKSRLFDMPVLIWANFVKDIQMIYSYLTSMGFKGTLVYGNVSLNQRQEIINNFQAGAYDFLVAHPVVLGIGVTLVRSNVCIYYSNSFRFEDRVQSEDRIHRVNQPKDTCYYIDLVAKNTIDELILQNLKNKKSLSKVTLKDLSSIGNI